MKDFKTALSRRVCDLIILALSLIFWAFLGTPAAARYQKDMTDRERLESRIKCKEVARRPGAIHQKCELEAEDQDARHVTIDFLQLTGHFAETARIHAELLAHQMDNGIISYVKSSKEKFLANLPENQKKLYSAILSCLVDRFSRSADPEFLQTHINLTLGLHDAGFLEYSPSDVLEMSFASELSVVFAGLQRKMKRSPAVGYGELFAMCGSHIVKAGFNQRRSFSLARDLLLRNDLESAFASMGCTGASSTRESSAHDSLWMSRNLDGSALGYFDKNPLVILHDPVTSISENEQGSQSVQNGINQLKRLNSDSKDQKRLHRYIGVASAGLHYAGGNSGFNDAGIGVTLHEMETENYRTNFPKKNGLTAVYLQNRILERASSIDEAWDILKSTGNYTAWTIVVGDAKTGEIAVFEFSGTKSVMAKRFKSGFHAQSNHFQSTQMDDQFYNYSFNKVLESRFRLKRVLDLENKETGHIGPQWFVNLLSDHWDWHQGLRSFGRNIIKTNTMMTQVFSPLDGTMITTLGDKYPVGQGSFLEFKVDFEKHKVGQNPFEMMALRKSENTYAGGSESLKNWRKSLGAYVESYIQYKSSAASYNNILLARDLLLRAIRLAEKDGIHEFTYWYIIGKIELKLAALQFKDKNLTMAESWMSLANASFNHLVEKVIAQDESRFNAYDRAIALVWRARGALLQAELKILAKGEISDAVPQFEYEERQVVGDFDRARVLVESLLIDERQDLELRLFLKSFSPRTGEIGKYTFDDASNMRIDFVTVE